MKRAEGEGHLIPHYEKATNFKEEGEHGLNAEREDRERGKIAVLDFQYDQQTAEEPNDGPQPTQGGHPTEISLFSIQSASQLSSASGPTGGKGS